MKEREIRFEIRFDPDAAHEYRKIDNSVLKIVNKKLEDLEERADVIGKPLSGNLAGYREIKLRDAGIRIIYEITDDKVDILTIVNILTINRRESGKVFIIAKNRIKHKKVEVAVPSDKSKKKN
jgi:mRNA interferase RelE/StbE